VQDANGKNMILALRTANIPGLREKTRNEREAM
jgi:hypothetical protein